MFQTKKQITTTTKHSITLGLRQDRIYYLHVTYEHITKLSRREHGP